MIVVLTLDGPTIPEEITTKSLRANRADVLRILSAVSQRNKIWSFAVKARAVANGKRRCASRNWRRCFCWTRQSECVHQARVGNGMHACVAEGIACFACWTWEVEAQQEIELVNGVEENHRSHSWHAAMLLSMCHLLLPLLL